MRKAIIVVAVAVPALILASLFGYVLYTGPRMKEQPHIRAYQTVAPLPPEGTVAVHVPEGIPSSAQAALATNPLEATDLNIERGKVYYGYYCIFCHGEEGRGNGPVGESYSPVPADLRSARVRGYRDGQLLRRMLTGAGHGPVLERVVSPRHRWHIVLYVRSLAAAP
ncbi:cytochrome C [Geobacter sp. DSM 9736]|uniref:c-type cytochrome n=1 Tax=Geobacter sp. DSM 9736 TaxID=1277350 RepID=UPI000B507295|nr:cytochrome C [Geobacter sp. DSM 9736]SNB46681.1 hypothetical protein SAMN06269301_2151 [Geobacter sp. DSM 9736]